LEKGPTQTSAEDQRALRTWAVSPLALTAIKAGAVLLIEWGPLRWIDHAPVAVWIGSVVVAVSVLAVLERQDWLNFKNRRYFPLALTSLITVWLVIIGVAYYLQFSTPNMEEPIVTDLRSQLASTKREGDIAIIERDAARRASPNIPVNPPPTPIEKLKADDVEARIDAWKSVEGQMNDFLRVLGEGDNIAETWKANQGSLTNAALEFRGHLGIIRNRLADLVGSYPGFSDLKLIDQQVPAPLASAIENLVQASSQFPKTATPAEYEAYTGPYIGPIRRQTSSVRRWVLTMKSRGASVSALNVEALVKTTSEPSSAYRSFGNCENQLISLTSDRHSLRYR
jgi:hypothetical protein